MKSVTSIVLFLCITTIANATIKDSTIIYKLPDSVKAVQFIADIKVQSINSKKELMAGIKSDLVKLFLEADKKEREIVFEFPAAAKIMATGSGADTTEKGEIAFAYNWELNETYKLLIAVATDSAANFSLYSGYAWLPKENKWKLIGSCKIAGSWNSIQSPATFYSSSRKAVMPASFGELWYQRNTGTWEKLKAELLTAPVINLFGHIDSIAERNSEIGLIEAAIASGKTDVKEKAEGLYFKMIKEGVGKSVSVNDTVTVNYKLTLFKDGSAVDGTKDKPAIFPLKRLIRGWQIGIPLCKVGGIIKLIIPSDLGYSIRTRSAKIPPNSILVFEIEVVDTKAPAN